MKVIPPIDTYPRLVFFAQSPAGKVAVIGVFAMLLLLNGRPEWIEMTAVAAAITFLPERRRALLSIGALYWLLVHGNEKGGVIRAVAAAEHIQVDGFLQALVWGIFAGMFLG